MQDWQEALAKAVPLAGVLGYLNFAAGKPDSRFQAQVNAAMAFLADQGVPQPWKALEAGLRQQLANLKAEGASAFRDARQVDAVLPLMFAHVIPAYRKHHRDLLGHLGDDELFQAFFLVRVSEAVLQQGPPWEERDRIVSGALQQLNDYVGHRPIAILESRPRGEPYAHERVRPIPLYIREAGVAAGKHHDLVQRAIEILQDVDPEILAEAYFDLTALEELALDPRAYDHGHPVNRRPNYVFGEWDPHHIDNRGRYRRYVARRVTLDALMDRVENPGELDKSEALFEAAAVFAGTILMASGTSGSGPATHDSTTSLATLMPRIARYRDAYYSSLLDKMSGQHADRLRAEAGATRQPFGGARQHLNQTLARHRAGQLQQRQLALIFADMGYPRVSREEAGRIPATSIRLLSEILGRLTTLHLLADRGELAEADRLLPEAEDLLHRGIQCGAFVDPWNILGFHGLFPLFTAREDSIRDTRIDDLVQVVERLFDSYSRLVSEAASGGDRDLRECLLERLRKLANWWDRFASVEVSDVRPVHGGDTVSSAEHVGHALACWHELGERAADLAFWKEHLQGFESPKSFALAVDALLRKSDYRAAMALLMNWLGQGELVSLEEGEYSFHSLALRWLLGYTAPLESETQETTRESTWPLTKKFFDYLEANAEQFWQVPTLELEDAFGPPSNEEEKDTLYSAAYQDVTYRDSTDDNEESSVAEGEEFRSEFDLERERDRLGTRLRFLSTVARLWQIAASRDVQPRGAAAAQRRERRETLAGFLATARGNYLQLLELLDAIGERPLPEPLGSYDSLVEYDQRRQLKEQLLYSVIGTCLDTFMAIGTLQGAAEEKSVPGEAPDWMPLAVPLEQAMLRGDVEVSRDLLARFAERFQHEQLLFTALSDGGQPRQVLGVRVAQSVLRVLLTYLPRLGLLQETYQLLKKAREMEQANPAPGRGVTEFNSLFQAAYQAVVEAVVEAAAQGTTTPARDQQVVDLLEGLARPFLLLWIEHSQTLQISTLETVKDEADWEAMRGFIRRYGHDLFHAKFMTLANLRGILHRGVDSYLDYLRDNPDPGQPVKLIEDLGRSILPDDARRWLRIILQALVENYEEYKDYNTTTPQSDYGENLHTLVDFLRLKASYDRQAWRLRPLVLAHDVLAQRGRLDLAVAWQEAFVRLTSDLAGQYLQNLDDLERQHGMRLRTIRDLVEERFIKPLELDRLCALIEPAMGEARNAEAAPSFSRLRRELESWTANPFGVGLDVPRWLRRLQEEVQRVRASHSNIGVLAEAFIHFPWKPISLEEVRRLLDGWEAS